MTSEIILASKPAGFDVEYFNKGLKNKFSIDAIDVELNNVRAGTFTKYTNKDSPLTSEGLQVKMTNGARFGSVFSITSNDLISSGTEDRTMLKVRWTPPAGLETKSNSKAMIYKLNKQVEVYTTLKHDMLIAGDWKLELETLEGDTLFSQTFSIN